MNTSKFYCCCGKKIRLDQVVAIGQNVTVSRTRECFSVMMKNGKKITISASSTEIDGIMEDLTLAINAEGGI
jgi:hypothetical protein